HIIFLHCYHSVVLLIFKKKHTVFLGNFQPFIMGSLTPILTSERGLTLSEEKTAITHINEGFDFLGWEFRETEKPTIWGII
ncbi:MAG: hypothetical protein AAGU09_06915, partial [Acetobacterium wieringae]